LLRWRALIDAHTSTVGTDGGPLPLAGIVVADPLHNTSLEAGPGARVVAR